ncbi:MAG: hypothetical protein NZ455_12550 [Bacteroidia bacterium]|nr:hypothetical protein [Bacteroidia bacterium]MDW8302282.1 hypothetical protein [Bacteroidia bacterium]
MKAYPTLESMALYFDTDMSTVCDYLKITKKSLKATLKAQGVFVSKIKYLKTNRILTRLLKDWKV